MQKLIFIVMPVVSVFNALAQTPVRKEPRHHNVFENNYVRVLDVFIPPKDSTQFHLHNTPSVFTTFTKTVTGSQLKGEQPVSTTSVAGYTWYDSLVTPRFHRVWNEDSNWFHVMDVELTGFVAQSNPAILNYSSLKLLFNAPLTNGYHLQLKPGSSIKFPLTKTGYLLISLADAVVEYTVNNISQRRMMKAGHYIWIEPRDAAFINAVDDAKAGFTLLQLK